MNVARALREIEFEAALARGVWPAFNSMHEGYSVILEELDELWDEIKTKPRDSAAVRAEAIQVGAMALRFLVDLCEVEEGP